MLLDTYYDGIEIHRREKIIYARFLSPHRVISTCRAAGGMHDDLVCQAMAIGFRDKWVWPAACGAEEKIDALATRN